MKCKYCKADVSPFRFYFHLARCKRERKGLIEQKINRRLTVPDDALLELLKNNMSQLNDALYNALWINGSYKNVSNHEKNLSLEEAIAINNLFWYAYTPWYGNSLVPGWFLLGKVNEYTDGIYGICYDFRTGPPDPCTFPINMIPAEIIAEALALIDITVDHESFNNKPPFQLYLNEIFSKNIEKAITNEQ